MPWAFFGAILLVGLLHDGVFDAPTVADTFLATWHYFLGAAVAVSVVKWFSTQDLFRNYELSVDEADGLLADNQQSCMLDQVSDIDERPGGDLRVETRNGTQLIIPGYIENSDEIRAILQDWCDIDDHTTGVAAWVERMRTYGPWLGAVLLPFVMAHFLKIGG